MAGSREDEFATDATRVVQVIRQRLPGPRTSAGPDPLAAPARRLERLLDAGAPAEVLREAAIAVVDACEWPCPAEIGGDDGPDIDPAVLAAVERLRATMDADNGEDDD